MEKLPTLPAAGASIINAGVDGKAAYAASCWCVNHKCTRACWECVLTVEGSYKHDAEA